MEDAGQKMTDRSAFLDVSTIIETVLFFIIPDGLSTVFNGKFLLQMRLPMWKSEA